MGKAKRFFVLALCSLNCLVNWRIRWIHYVDIQCMDILLKSFFKETSRIFANCLKFNVNSFILLLAEAHFLTLEGTIYPDPTTSQSESLLHRTCTSLLRLCRALTPVIRLKAKPVMEACLEENKSHLAMNESISDVETRIQKLNNSPKVMEAIRSRQNVNSGSLASESEPSIIIPCCISPGLQTYPSLPFLSILSTLKSCK
ncbi:uncharacterized protein LOC131516620 isoform X1 [Neofelis nebulosa]|uniref:uncharacterized protein LOC131516620 isoform X1 n=1 Tax=Neofelis nebulosa TaxID=61452 RepID=UPI00272D2961|nr:uncharacterized protein LOC131516620 isoform X1 [Neofelis nebulosa]